MGQGANDRRRWLGAGAALGLQGLMPARAFAQAAAPWAPARQVRLVVPFPAAGAADLAARLLSQHLSQALGKPVVVDNRGGADGLIAAQEVMRSPPDGHTIFFATASALSYTPSVRKAIPYDPVADFSPITYLCTFTFFFIVHESVPVRTMEEFVAYARANPGKLSYATGNSTGIVATAQLAQTAKLDMVHVPYKGEAQAVLDFASGRVQAMFATPAVIPTLKPGSFRALAVLLPTRSALLPEVPTMAEAGQPLVDVAPWGGYFGPAKMPREIVDRYVQEIHGFMKRPDMREQMDKIGLPMRATTPEEMGEFVRQQLAAWGKTVREAKIQVD
jgi:tripartite-type tricarboxylate transporter receptor subunit TctC